MDIRETLLDAIQRADRGAALAALDAWAAEHGWERLLAEVLEPTLLAVGEQWDRGEGYTIAQVYVAGRIAGDMLTRMAEYRRARSDGPAPVKAPVVIGNIEEDFHALGRKLVGTFAAADGWGVHDLGNDVPAERFVDEALRVGARVIGVSAMMLTTAQHIAKVRAEIDRRGLNGRLQLAVGGAIFLARPSLVAEVGGDGTSHNALGASALFERLAARAAAAGALP